MNDGDKKVITDGDIPKITTDQGDDYATHCQLKKHYEMIAIDLAKQQPLDADPKSNTIN